MIDSLNGEVLEIAVDHVVLDLHGVGYLVHAPASTLDSSNVMTANCSGA